MAVDPREGVYEHAEFSGLRNTVPTDRFGLDDLAVATNVDIDDSKRVARRTGHSTAVVSGVITSLWSNGATALAVRNGTELIQILPDYTVVSLRTGLSPNLRMSYAPLADRVYYANGVDTGCVQNGASRTWGLAIPTGQPVAAVMGGVLPAGRYQFAVTYLRADRQESGTSPATTIDLTDTGGVSLSAIPVSADPGVARKAVYFSKCNGETLYRAGLLAADATSFTYQLESSMQVPLMTQHLRPAPAGSIVRVFNGRTLVAHGNTLRYSEPYAPELFDLRKGYTLAGPITMVEPLDGGVYLGTADEVVWLEGDTPEKWDMRPRLTYGCIPGASAVCSRDMVLDGAGSQEVVLFATAQGTCLGDGSGQILNLTQDRFLYPVQEQGAAVVRRHRGMVQLVVTMQGTETAASVA